MGRGMTDQQSMFPDGTRHLKTHHIKFENTFEQDIKMKTDISVIVALAYLLAVVSGLSFFVANNSGRISDLEPNETSCDDR